MKDIMSLKTFWKLVNVSFEKNLKIKKCSFFFRILHGDLKAANVLIIGEFDAVKLCDFGVTVPLQKDGTTDPTCQYVGTEPWSAPEVIEEEEITDKADIFALGKL